MAEPDWQLWDAILRELQADMRTVKGQLTAQGAKLDAIDHEVRGLKGMAKLVLGSASGAEFVAEKAERLIEETNQRLDEPVARVAKLEEAH